MTDDELVSVLTYTVVTDPFGNRIYYNSHGQVHRAGGPAIITLDGSEYWYCNGKQHRSDGPAATWPGHPGLYYLNGAHVSAVKHKRLTDERSGTS